jgi:uncharacterized membrane protein YqjE
MTTSDARDATLGELFGALGDDLSQLLRQEAELAKVEAREEARRVARGASMAIFAAVATLLALTMLSAALAWWIDEGLNTAVAFAIVGTLWLVAAIAAAMTARSAISRVEPLPQTADAIRGAVTGDRADRSADAQTTRQSNVTTTQPAHKETSS